MSTSSPDTRPVSPIALVTGGSRGLGRAAALTLAALCLALTAQAQNSATASDQPHTYGLLSLGQGRLNADCSGVQACDRNATGGKAIVGYAFGNGFSLEGGYSHFGKFRASDGVAGLSARPEAVSLTGAFTANLTPDAETGLGKWTLPAGFMELGETTAEGAARETDEEAGAAIDMEGLFTVLNVARVGQVHFYYLARLQHTTFDPGHETQEVRLFREADIPWDEIAFKTVKTTLECYFNDRRAGRFGVHTADIA